MFGEMHYNEQIYKNVLQPCIDVKMYGLMKILNGSDIQMEPTEFL